MTSSEPAENFRLGQELLIGVSDLTADVFLRSRLPADIGYSAIELSKLHTPDEEISLMVFAEDDNICRVLFGEAHRSQTEEGGECFDLGLSIGLRVQGDGSGLQSSHGGHGSMSLTEATGYLIRRLPDFAGAGGNITVDVEEAQ